MALNSPRRGVRSVEERLWEKVERTETCWNWTGCVIRDGYGQMMYKTKDVRLVHRISWELANGAIPVGSEIDHVCHNRVCVNPGHLRLATRAENNQNLSGERKNNKSGHRGVFWSKEHSMWRARIQKDNRPYEVGLFRELEDAAEAVRAKRIELFAFNPADAREAS